MSIPHHYSIDRFSVFEGAVAVEGWIFASDRTIERIELMIANDTPVEVARGFDSADVVAVHGEGSTGSRFRKHTVSGQPDAVILEATLHVTFHDGATLVLDALGLRQKAAEPPHRLFLTFLEKLHAAPPGRFLEIGSRARSGVVRKQLIPPSLAYVGFDILPGPNVDVVGDAHRLSTTFEPASFDGVMAISVLEHILMPWKFAIELNRVLRVGGHGFFLTHQTWALHETPWDYWRFSADAWPAIFNRYTGFEIVEACAGEPAFIIPHRCDRGNFSPYLPGYLASAVLVRKVNETALEWGVNVEDIVSTAYPAP